MRNIFKIHYIKYLLLLILSYNLLSCESLIDIDLPDDQINTEDVFKDINTAKGALANLYINVRQSSLFNGSYTGLGTIASLHTDDLNPYGQATNSITIANVDIYNGNIVSTNSAITNLWTSSYFHIYAINAFINGLSKSNSISENEKKVMLAEARFLRVLYYQYLTQLFNDIPYTSSTDYNYNKSINKLSQNQLYLSLENELDQIIQDLPIEYRHKDRIFPNKSTAELLLAQNYLLQKKYDKAIIQATNVVNNSVYTLETSLDKVFKKDAKSTIWQLSPSDVNIATLEATNYYFSNKPVTHYLSPSLVNSFEESDLRKQNWIRKIEDNNTIWYHNYKYKNVNNNTDEYSIVFRLEEVYFVLVEAYINQNQTDKASNFLNKIRKRAGLKELPNNLSQEQLKDELLKECRKEFFCENGHRFLDLKRNNKLTLIEQTKPTWNDKHQLFPIPESEILLNTNLLPQNDGY